MSVTFLCCAEVTGFTFCANDQQVTLFFFMLTLVLRVTSIHCKENYEKYLQCDIRNHFQC